MNKKIITLVTILLALSLTSTASSTAATSSKSKLEKAMKVRDAKILALHNLVTAERKSASEKLALQVEAANAIEDKATKESLIHSAYQEKRATYQKIREEYNKKLHVIYSQFRKSIM
jgi:dimeric dUTPase (all-alpha-NTP-PPase superfamily)